MKIDVWTDGSINLHRNNKPGGWAAILVQNNFLLDYTYKGVKNTTSNAMELMAIIKGILYTLNKYPKVKEIEVFSDSAYCVNCIICKWYVTWQHNGWYNSKGELVANKNLWEQLLKTLSDADKSGVKVQLTKVKGHSGLLYNEMADRYACTARKSIE